MWKLLRYFFKANLGNHFRQHFLCDETLRQSRRVVGGGGGGGLGRIIFDIHTNTNHVDYVRRTTAKQSITINTNILNKELQIIGEYATTEKRQLYKYLPKGSQQNILTVLDSLENLLSRTSVSNAERRRHWVKSDIKLTEISNIIATYSVM